MRRKLTLFSFGFVIPSTLACLACLLSCATLEPIPATTCGNGVIDSDREDCDSFPTATCGKPTDGIKACRLTCDRKQAPSTCPTGWGCGVDGICRQSQGIIESAGTPASAGAASLIVGDFDGDGRVDVIGAAPYGSGGIARVHYYDGNANLETTVPLQVAVNLPVIRDFNKDGLDDVGFSAGNLDGGAFSVLSGGADRTFATLLFPALTMPRTEALPVPIITNKRTQLPQGLASTVVAIINNDQGPRLVSIGEDVFIGEAALNIVLPFGPSIIAAQPRSALVFNPALQGNSPCGDIVVPWNEPGSAGGKGKISIISPCSQPAAASSDVRWNNKKPATFDAPGPITGLLVADLNFDGLDDIVIQTTGTNGGIYVASAKDDPTASQFKRSELKELPLAVADLTGDGIPDFVFPSGVVISTVKLVGGDAGVGGGELKLDGQVTITPRGSTGLKWVDAKIGNFNNDNIPDILVRYENQLDADLLGNAGDGRFTRFVVRSDKPVRSITNGDFDGDLIQDVAYLSSARSFVDPSGSGDVDLVIAYGKNSGGTETPRVVGRFKNARALAALKNADTAHDDLGVLESIPSGQPNVLPTTSVTVLFGSGERQAIAPLFLQDERATTPYDAKVPGARGRFRFWSPAIITAGAMSEPNSLDVFAIAVGVTVDRTPDASGQHIPFETGAWIAGHDQNLQGGIAPFQEVARLTPALAAVDERTPNNPEVSIVSTVGDVDLPPNGIDEVVNIARTPNGGTAVFVVRPSTQNGQPSPNVILPDTRVKGGDPIELIDVDSDGAADLVFITEQAGKRKLFVLFNNGKGDFNKTPSEIRMPAGNDEQPVGFAKLVTGTRADGKLRMEIVVVTRTHLAIANLAPGGLFETRDLSDRLGKAGVSLTGIVSGDFDGNGTQDIAIADSGSVRILRQLPRLP